MVTKPFSGPRSAMASHRRLGDTARQDAPLLSAASVMKRCRMAKQTPCMHYRFVRLGTASHRWLEEEALLLSAASMTHRCMSRRYIDVVPRTINLERVSTSLFDQKVMCSWL